MTKEQLNYVIQETQKILVRQNYSETSIAADGNTLKQEISNFRAKVLLAGQFSSGKSALINAFLGGEEILKENITPQTAIATELYYGDSEKFIRVYNDGRQETLSKQEIEQLPVTDCKKDIYILNNEALKKFSNLVLVDMPGFDSGIEAHNKALLQYVGEATAYLFVIDVTKGTISASAEQFLFELQKYTPIIRFVLTKCDKVTNSMTQQIKNSVEAILEGILMEKPQITLISSRDASAQQKMTDILHDLPENLLLLQHFRKNIVDWLMSVLQILNVKQSSLNFNPHDFEVAAQISKRRQENFQYEMAKEKRKLHQQMQIEYMPKVLSDVQNALIRQSSSLARTALTGDTVAFQRAVNDILRPVLMDSVQQNLDNIFENLIESLEQSLDVDTIDAADIMGKVKGAMDGITKIGEMGKNFAKLHKYKQMYTAISTGLAVVTNVVAPWLELVIIFLPDIIGALGKLLGPSKEEEAQRQIEHQVIPEICEKLREQIANSVSDTEAQMVQEIEEHFQKMISQEEEALHTLEQNRDMQQQNIEQQKASIKNDMKMVHEFIQIVEGATE